MLDASIVYTNKFRMRTSERERETAGDKPKKLDTAWEVILQMRSLQLSKEQRGRK